MATYYVRPDGSNGNTGLGSASNQAWLTISHALINMILDSGDNYLYIAPGIYRESPIVTITPTSTNRLVISGNPTASLFPGIVANQVRLTGATNDSTTMSTGHRLNLSSKTYITVENLYIEVNGSSSSSFGIYGSGNNLTIQKCVIYSYYTNTGSLGGCIGLVFPSITGNATTVRQCILRGSPYCIYAGCPAASSGVSGFSVQNCALISNGTSTSTGFIWVAQSGPTTSSAFMTNCLISGHATTGVNFNNGNSVDVNKIQNCIIFGNTTGLTTYPANTDTSFYNLFNNSVNVTGLSLGTGSIVSDYIGIDFGQNLLQGFGNIAPNGTMLGSRNTSFGISSNAPLTDIYGISWTGTTPDIGFSTYRNLSGIGSYLPTERNASSITIAPGSTSQSIELYLGATGLTFNTSGLQAYYVRNRSTPVQISLVSQTATGAWTSGGFAEINSTTMPGIYRLDVPNAAFASGASDVTINVRGAVGTNGAVLTVNLAYTQIDMSQSVPTSNTAHTVGDALNAARAYGFGKWVISGTTLSLYASDNTTVIKTFTLDSGSYPTSRT